MDLETLLLDRKGHTLLLTLNRPENLNSYNEVMHRELNEVWDQVNADDGIWTVVTTGAGRAFCAGADMKEASVGQSKGQLGPPRWEAGVDALGGYRHEGRPGTGLPRPEMGFPAKVLISAINGICCGDGLGWLYRADFAICSERAIFFDPHVNVCITPPSLQNMPLCAARTSAFAIELLGNPYRTDAKRALELGLVTEVVPHEQLLERALEVAEEVNRYSGGSAGATKAFHWATHDMNYKDAHDATWSFLNQASLLDWGK